LDGDLFGSFSDSGEPIRGERCAPALPPTIYGIGLNYREHAEEMSKPLPEFPVVFMKSPTAVQIPANPSSSHPRRPPKPSTTKPNSRL